MKIKTLAVDKKTVKESAMITKICQECGRRDKIPVYYCNRCIRTMNDDLIKSK